jgi:hypothetical protein
MAPSRPDLHQRRVYANRTKHPGGAIPRVPLLPDWTAGPSMSASRRLTRKYVAQASTNGLSSPTKRVKRARARLSFYRRESVYHASVRR